MKLVINCSWYWLPKHDKSCQTRRLSISLLLGAYPTLVGSNQCVYHENAIYCCKQLLLYKGMSQWKFSKDSSKNKFVKAFEVNFCFNLLLWAGSMWFKVCVEGAFLMLQLQEVNLMHFLVKVISASSNHFKRLLQRANPTKQVWLWKLKWIPYGLLKPKFVYLNVSFYEGFFTTENNLKHADTLYTRMVWNNGSV